VAVEILGDRVVNDAVLRDCETTIFQTTGATLRLEETPMPAERRVDPGSVSAKQAPFGFLIQTLATEASGRGLTRMGKHVFEPHPRISGALVRGQQHLTFINQTLRADPVYQKGNYASTLGAWFEKQDDERFPMLEPDDVSRTTIAFQDGWLDAATGNWYPRDDAERGEAEVPKKPATTFHFFDVRAAKHMGAPTPLWDTLIKTQLYGREWAAGDTEFTEKLERFNVFEALIGRLFVPAGLDNWQVVLFLIGAGNKGKGTVVKLVQSMFPDDSVAAFNSSGQKSFSLQHVDGKRLVVFPDLAKDIKKSLPGDVFRSLVSAESVSVPRKYQATTTENWSVPMLMAANEFPSYDDEGGRLSRRLAVFVFDTSVKHTDTQLCKKIRESELPAIVLRCIAAYHNLLRHVGDGSFRDSLNAGVLPSMDDVEIARSPLARFVAEGDDVYAVVRDVGSETPLQDLQDAFEDHARCRKLKTAEWSDHCAIIKRAGFEQAKVNVCRTCGLRASQAGCRGHYNPANRTRKMFVMGMRLEQKVSQP
jgi:hypothetical protein